MRRSARTLPPVWQLRAVRDLVALVAHAAQRLAAARARRAVARRAPRSARRASAATARRCARARARARRRARRGPRRAGARARRRRATRATRTATAARATARRRRSRGRRPATVRWSRSSVWTRRRSSPWRIELGELVGVGLGAEAFERAVVAGREHPPRGLALVPVLAHERRPLPFGEAEPHDRALGARLLRRVLEVEAAGLREVHAGSGPTSPKSRIRYLASRPTRSSGRADERLGRRAPPSSAPRTRAARPPRAPRRRARRRGARPAPASAAARARALYPARAAPAPPATRRDCCILRRISSRRSWRSRKVSVSTSESTRNAAFIASGSGVGAARRSRPRA